MPLVARASVASDRSLIPAGSILLAEVPLLNQQGKFTGHYQMRLMVALDVGGAIKGSTSISIKASGQRLGTGPVTITTMAVSGC